LDYLEHSERIALKAAILYRSLNYSAHCPFMQRAIALIPATTLSAAALARSVIVLGCALALIMAGRALPF